MIKITKMALNYEASLKQMMVKEGIYEDLSLVYDTMYIVLDGSNVLGFGYSNIYDGEIYLDHLYIETSERLSKLGDSLFRALLNSLALQGITTVYMRNNPIYNDFLNAEDIYLHGDRYEISLDEFFSRKCKGSKKEDIH